MKIGIFDSGIGGLTVLAEALKEIPKGEFIYFADTGNVPYGTKSKEEVKDLVLRAGEFLYSKKIDALVVACNTATSIGIEELRKKYNVPIIGMEPAVKLALNKEDNKKVLVMATDLTLKEDKFKNLVHQTGGDSRVEALPMPGLVLFAEKMIFSGKDLENYIKLSLADYDLRDFSTLVLGCTHFIYFRDIIRGILPEHIEIIDGNKGTVKNLLSKLNSCPINENNGSISFYSSSHEWQEEDFLKYLFYLEQKRVN